MTASELLRRAGSAAATYGRMTREDAAGLGAVFMQVARRQATDALHARRAGMRTALAGGRDGARAALADRLRAARRALTRVRAGSAGRGR